MRRYLVTGGAGFIGSHIVESLVKKGHFVRVLDNFIRGKRENLRAVCKDVEVVRGDIRSQEVCRRATKRIEVVFHQAALRSVPQSMRVPAEYNAVNISGTLNLLEASLQNKVRRVIFASSSSVYGDVPVFPQKESFLPQPVSHYALTKLVGEHYCKIYNGHYGLETVALRYFNVFGPRQSLDDEYAIVIPKFIDCMLRKKSPPIFGNGRQSRDLVFIDNVVQANLRAADRYCVDGGVFNVASGNDTTILELVAILNKIMHTNIKPVFMQKRPGDVFKTLADLSLARKAIGYTPCVEFSQGLMQTVKYFKSRVVI
ncbi:MAG: SDR family oxidoreductase [Candidatus Omnitrophica bacterium]|nr:SDR family oxidoreductase [Candidatus Omnitrophota bacterium]